MAEEMFAKLSRSRFFGEGRRRIDDQAMESIGESAFRLGTLLSAEIGQFSPILTTSVFRVPLRVTWNAFHSWVVCIRPQNPSKRRQVSLDTTSECAHPSWQLGDRGFLSVWSLPNVFLGRCFGASVSVTVQLNRLGGHADAAADR